MGSVEFAQVCPGVMLESRDDRGGGFADIGRFSWRRKGTQTAPGYACGGACALAGEGHTASDVDAA